MLDIEVTQFPGGIGTANDNSVLNAVPLPLPFKGALSVEDFDQMSLFDSLWSVANIGAGAASSNPISPNGILQYVSAGASGDGTEAQANAGAGITDGFAFVVGKEAFFACRWMIDDPVEATIIQGFVPEGSGLAPADGVYLRIDDGDALVDLVVENNATAQSVATGLATIAPDTWYETGIYWDGVSKVSLQITGPDGVIGGGGNLLPGANLPAVGLDPTLTFAAGEAAAKTIQYDWVAFGGSR